jgi:hypothetical protein
VTPIAMWAVVARHRPHAGRPGRRTALPRRPAAGLARPLRFVAGIGGYLLLGLVPAPWTFVQFVFAAASVVLVFTTRDGRGLPGLLSGQRLVDAREPAAAVGDGGRFTTRRNRPETGERPGAGCWRRRVSGVVNRAEGRPSDPRLRVTAERRSTGSPTGPSAPSVSANTLYEGVPFLNEERWGSKAKRMLPEARGVSLAGAGVRARTSAALIPIFRPNSAVIGTPPTSFAVNSA